MPPGQGQTHGHAGAAGAHCTCLSKMANFEVSHGTVVKVLIDRHVDRLNLKPQPPMRELIKVRILGTHEYMYSIQRQCSPVNL